MALAFTRSATGGGCPFKALGGLREVRAQAPHHNSPQLPRFFFQLPLPELLTLAPACVQLAAKCPIFNRCARQAQPLPRP